MPRLLTVLPALLLAVASAVAVSGCESDEPADAQAAPTGEETTAADCDRVIPAATVTALGWSNDAGASYSVRGCERRADQGYLKVRELSVPGGGAAEAVQEEFDARCAELDTFPDPGSATVEPATGMLVTWLGEGVTACAVEPDAGIGLSKVLLVTPSGRLVELWVAALEPTEQDRVRGAMAALVEAAATAV